MSNYSDSYIRGRLKQLNDDITEGLLPVMVYIGLLMALGIVGNVVVCYVFGFRLRMNTQHFLIISLAVIDLLNCLIAMPSEILNLTYFYTFENKFACTTLTFLRTFCAFSSILTLVIIAMDRYLKVCRPMKRQMSMFEAKLAMAALLLLSLITSCSAILLNGVTRIETDDPQIQGYHCFIRDSMRNTSFPIAYNITLIVAFFTTLICLTFMYVRIWRYMKHHNQYIRKFSTQSVSSPRDDLIYNPPETQEINIVMDDINNLEDNYLAELSTASKKCTLVDSDISNPSVNMSMPSPLTGSQITMETVYSSVEDNESLVNMFLLLSCNANNETSPHNTDHHAYPAPLIYANNPVRKERADTILSSSGNISIESKDRGGTGTLEWLKRSMVSEISPEKATMVAITVTFVFFFSFLPHLCLVLTRLLFGLYDRRLKGVLLILFNISLKSYLINSVSNPIIYSVHNLRFRAEFLELMRQFLLCGKWS